MDNYIDKLKIKAIDIGATGVESISIENVIIEPWVRAKCMYGCAVYGTHFTCPPYVPSFEICEKIIKSYNNSLLLQFKPPSPLDNYIDYKRFKAKKQNTIALLERAAFLGGYYRAFALGSGPCVLCDKCRILEIERSQYKYKTNRIINNFTKILQNPQLILKLIKRPKLIKTENRPINPWCKNSSISRPSMEAFGIDVFKTVVKAGFEINVLHELNEIPTFYSLLLLE